MKQTFLSALSKTIGILRKNPAGPELPSIVISSYNAARGKPSSNHICHAPFSNMYFNVHGHCAPCWLTFIEPDSYPQKSIREIWFGEKFQSLRKNLLAYNLTDKCNVCLKNLNGGNYTSVLARAYDVNEPADFPSMLELELSNTCNLECVMCIGELSSSIRKNREHLPPIQSPYDQAFVEQLEEFIPHLKELRFNGGEPFLINIVFEIFKKVEKLNPKLKITIATNGTVLNNKVKEWLNKLNIHINFSLDSLTPDIYEAIRVNAKFQRVIEHFSFYHEYCKTNNRTLCVMVNPMRNNWHEMPDFINFVNKYNVNIWFNTIHRPIEWSIWALPSSELERIYIFLSKFHFRKEELNAKLASYNLGVYKNLVEVQFKNWWKEAQEREKSDEIQSLVITEQIAQRILREKITTFIYLNTNEGEEQKKYRLQHIFEKFDRVKIAVQNKYSNEDFYIRIHQSPADLLIKEFESKTELILAEEYRKHYFNQIDL
jgi:molybdenum cofactor biosynthesis enzyme MoaA